MQLIFLYGPPAVGKLTVAKALSKRTGFKVFHNQLTIDLVESIFEWGTAAFIELIHRYRFELVEKAAASDLPGLIFTYVFEEAKTDIAFVKTIREIVEKEEGTVHFVRLTCDPKTLEARVQKPSRKKHRKISSVKALREILKTSKLFAEIPGSRSLTIDTGKNSPVKSAQEIQSHFSLPSA